MGDAGNAPRGARTAKWYVLQTIGGHESKVMALVSKLVDPELITELFMPQRQVRKRYGDTWREMQEKILPGYVFVVTPDPEQLAGKLYVVPEFTRLLHTGDSFTALTADEVAFINAFTEPGHRIIDISQGVIEGDEITILNGPLMGRQGLIRKIDRHKRLAVIEMPVMGRMKTIKVGLEIIRKRP